MSKYLFVLLILLGSMPAMAEPSLSPSDIEQLPFDHSLANTPNTQSLYSDTDTNAQHGNTTSGVQEKKKAGLPQFDTTTFASQIFWLAVMFFVLYIFFAKKALPTLSKTMEDREATISKNIEQANSLSEDIDRIREEYDAAIQKAHDDARGEIIETEKNIRMQAEREAEVFQEKSAAAIDNLEKHVSKTKDAIKADLESVAVELTQDIMEKLTSVTVKNVEVEKVISDYMNEETSTPEKKAA